MSQNELPKIKMKKSFDAIIVSSVFFIMLVILIMWFRILN